MVAKARGRVENSSAKFDYEGEGLEYKTPERLTYCVGQKGLNDP